MGVTDQPHYTAQPIQPIRVMHLILTPDEFRGFLKGNIIKYITRADFKGGQEDLDKADVYARWLIEFNCTGDITVPGESD